MKVLGLFLGAGLVAGCITETGSTESIDQREESVVGGAAEYNYPAAGFIYFRQSDSYSVKIICSGALIAPNVVVTAAHCLPSEGSVSIQNGPEGTVYVADDRIYGIGFGEVDNAQWYEAKWIESHPFYDPSGHSHKHPDDSSNATHANYYHDIGLLILNEEVTDITPLVIAESQENDIVRHVGYGRTSLNNYDVGERKSASHLITKVDEYNIISKGIDGTSCKGDSGGPLLKDQYIYAVLTADVLLQDEYCEIGNDSLSTSLSGDALTSFIKPTLSDWGVALPTAVDQQEACVHSECETGDALESACSSCSDDVCAIDPYCCSTEWDDLCVDEAVTYCSGQCGYSECTHSECEEGEAMDSQCSTCSMAVCDYDSYCCETDWDDLCVDEANTFCACE